MNHNEPMYWLALNETGLIGPRRWQRLLRYFKTIKEVWAASPEQLARAGLEQKTIEQLTTKKIAISPEHLWHDIDRQKITVITMLDRQYPALLKEIYAPPPVLYCYGRLEHNGQFPLAIVGSRKTTGYGRQVTADLTTDLTRAGLTTISGLALGIDTITHQATLAAGGKTIAVLGCGLNSIYPLANRRLAHNIVAGGGAVVSEFPLDTPPFKSNFPRRNRIIAGMSLGVLVTEAGEKSGALITARYAVEQNREVFCVPGSIYNKNSVGPNTLIKNGAKMVTTVADILETLSLEQAPLFLAAQKITADTAAEETLLAMISDEPTHVDKLVQSARLTISTINATLAVMEMKGLIKNIGNQTYIKPR